MRRFVLLAIVFGVLAFMPAPPHRHLAQAQSTTCWNTSTLGWCQVPSINMSNVCANPNSTTPALQGNGNTADTSLCGTTVGAWSGGVWDSANNRFLIFGGGHTDYNGNEIYAVNFAANPITMTLVKNPSNPTGVTDNSTSCTGSYTDGNPASRHTYQGLVYLPTTAQMLMTGGSVACGSGAGPVPPETWRLTVSGLTWAKDNYTGTGPSHFNSTNYQTDNIDLFDYNSGNVYASDPCFHYYYVLSTKVWTQLDNSCTGSTEATAAVDPQRKLWIEGGLAAVRSSTLVTSQWNISSLTLTGCSQLANAAGPGISYMPSWNTIFYWTGDGHVYSFNPDTKTCTPVSTSIIPASPDPGAENNQGTFGRFVCNDSNGNGLGSDGFRCILINLPASATDNLTEAASRVQVWVLNAPPSVCNWTCRSTSAGVIQALPLSASTDVTNAHGLIRNQAGACSTSFDTGVAAPDRSGATLVIGIQQNPSGDLQCGPQWGFPASPTFGEGSDFYYQWQEYWDANFLANSIGPYTHGTGSGEGLKHVLLWGGGQPSGCGSIELMHVDQGGNGYPQINTDCGSFELGIASTISNPGYVNLLSSANIPASQVIWEQGANLPTSSSVQNSGDTSYNCYYQSGGSPANLRQGCALFKSGVWMTFYCHQHTTTWGATNGPGGGGDLTTQCWIQFPGGPMLQYINMNHYNMAFNNGHGDLWNTVEFTPYDTGQGSVVAPAANKRYANWILSTQPIPAPNISATGAPVPPPPVTGVRFGFMNP